MTNPALTNGPNRDGSQSLAKESKVGQLVTLVVAGALFALADGLGSIDVSPLPDWLEATAATALAALAGLAAAWAKRNR